MRSGQISVFLACENPIHETETKAATQGTLCHNLKGHHYESGMQDLSTRSPKIML